MEHSVYMTCTGLRAGRVEVDNWQTEEFFINTTACKSFCCCRCRCCRFVTCRWATSQWVSCPKSALVLVLQMWSAKLITLHWLLLDYK